MLKVTSGFPQGMGRHEGEGKHTRFARAGCARPPRATAISAPGSCSSRIIPVVLAPTTVKPTPGPREDAISPERVREMFWNEMRFISAINVLGLPGAVVPVTLHEAQPIGVQLIAGAIARISRSMRRRRSRSGRERWSPPA
jgi:Asp-tRNA(Asn)/Glu-tRNA(Gln) amidotransferase A subunit family amidase